MKRLLILLLAIFVSCAESKSPEKVLNENLTAYMQDNAKDPSSYEQMETKIIDTFFVDDLYRTKISSLKDQTKKYQDEIIDIEIESKKRQNEIENEKYESVKNIIREYIKENDTLIIEKEKKMRSMVRKVDSLEANIPKKSIAFISATHKCRLKNGFGALDISNYYVLTDSTLSIIDIYDDRGDMFLTINSLFEKNYLK